MLSIGSTWAEHGSGTKSHFLARAAKKPALCAFLPPFPSQNEKELQEVIQQQNEKILEQIDKSGELIVCSS